MLSLSRVKFEFYNDFPWIPYNIFLKKWKHAKHDHEQFPYNLKKAVKNILHSFFTNALLISNDSKNSFLFF